eukprot:GHRQ01024807.1.p1 GENE.GHRQ01024807.1~~GHRQ01024807.1.p1  ORF type:complete len:128 (+),score=26.91 GHRQ01024807.1:586-969(+)
MLALLLSVRRYVTYRLGYTQSLASQAATSPRQVALDGRANTSQPTGMPGDSVSSAGSSSTGFGLKSGHAVPWNRLETVPLERLYAKSASWSESLVTPCAAADTATHCACHSLLLPGAAGEAQYTHAA